MRPKPSTVAAVVLTVLLEAVMITFLLTVFTHVLSPSSCTRYISVTADPMTDKSKKDTAAQSLLPPVTHNTADWKIDMGPLMPDNISDDRYELHAVVTPLKGQKGYGELNCAFYSAQNHLIATSMDNWSDDPHADPIDVDLSFQTNGTQTDHGNCWVHQL